MGCPSHVWHYCGTELLDVLRDLSQDTILVRGVSSPRPSPTISEVKQTQQPTEQAIANGAFALGMATGIAFVTAALMLAKLLSF